MVSEPRKIVILATLDTKLDPAIDLCAELSARGATPVIIDLSVKDRVDVPGGQSVLRAFDPAGAQSSEQKLGSMEQTVAEAQALLRGLIQAGAVGAVGLGGGQGTSLCVSILAAAPEIARVVVTTSPAGVTLDADLAGLIVVHSVTDVVGRNPILRQCLAAAAAAVAELAQRDDSSTLVPLIALSMQGITTEGAQTAAARLERSAQVATFHANGTGGASMERVIRSGVVSAVLDFTTSELMAEVAGGANKAGRDRLTAAAQLGVPQVVVPGGVDTIILRSREVPEIYSGRSALQHTADILLIRANPREMAEAGALTAERLIDVTAPTVLLVPEKGFSEHDRLGGPFEDAEADAAYVQAVKAQSHSAIDVRVVPLHVNDKAFAQLAAQTLLDLRVEHENYQKLAGTK